MLPIVAKRLITISVASGFVVAGASTTAVAQLTRVADSSWTVSRTADGQPDLQGIWGNKTLTPMERRENDEGKSFLSDEEIARINQQRVVDEQARNDAPAQRYQASRHPNQPSHDPGLIPRSDSPGRPCLKPGFH